jgi:hypothetical protein
MTVRLLALRAGSDLPSGSKLQGHKHLKIVIYSIDWIHLSQDKDPWRALVNTVKNLHAP